MKDKNAKTILHGFVEIINKSKRKPNKLWFDQERELYNSSMQKWLDNNDILTYPAHNEGRSVVAERFIRTLKGKKMTANDNKSYLGYLNKLVDECNNTCNSSIGKKPIDPNYSVLTEEIESSHKVPKFKVYDSVRITKYKNIFGKGYTEN